MPKLKRINVPFTQVANSILNNNELTCRAKGLFAYLYSKPETWQFSYIRIAQDHKEGKNAILRTLQELEAFGYLQREKQPDGRTTYVLTYKPKTQIGSQADPKTQKAKDPKSQRPKLGHISNKDSTKKERRESNKELAGASPADRRSDIPLREAMDNANPTKKQKYNPLGAEIIKAFESIDLQNKTYYSNTTQRNACDFLIEEYGLPQVLKVVTELLPKTNKRPRYEFPHISTPHQLKVSWAKLADSAHVKSTESKENSVAFT